VEVGGGREAFSCGTRVLVGIRRGCVMLRILEHDLDNMIDEMTLVTALMVDKVPLEATLSDLDANDLWKVHQRAMGSHKNTAMAHD
jgi:hypothetical protein